MTSFSVMDPNTYSYLPDLKLMSVCEQCPEAGQRVGAYTDVSSSIQFMSSAELGHESVGAWGRI